MFADTLLLMLKLLFGNNTVHSIIILSDVIG